ncbi:hypothetical protein PBY51_010874 [Eleginops maclovinus]|uniref:Uncharacterized protein n=1 Tax=Eleginops maclovinus TaxID=56733 RepID=A0AAN7XBJ8_ELEMC|nr:hypothetical protein PBY51_010874 [Eleginops maclovinus]
MHRRLSPLSPRFTHNQVPVRAYGKSHGILLLFCEALETDETRRQSGCRVAPLGMAGSRGAVWHPLPPVPVGRGGKSSGVSDSDSLTPCDITLPGGWEGMVSVWTQGVVAIRR